MKTIFLSIHVYIQNSLTKMTSEGNKRPAKGVKRKKEDEAVENNKKIKK